MKVSGLMAILYVSKALDHLKISVETKRSEKYGSEGSDKTNRQGEEAVQITIVLRDIQAGNTSVCRNPPPSYYLGRHQRLGGEVYGGTGKEFWTLRVKLRSGG
jgi:hypothetical protein